MDRMQGQVPAKSEVTFTVRFRASSVGKFSSAIIAKPVNVDASKDSSALTPLAVILNAETEQPSLTVDKRRDIEHPYIFRFAIFALGDSPRRWK
jgi:hypothetical protein